MRNVMRLVMVAAVAWPLAGTTPAAAQGQEVEAAMVAAGEWARGQVPGGALRLDPHRTGRSPDRALARRVASALGAELGTLEETRTCVDVTDPSTCRLRSAALLAIGAPAITGDSAVVRVYAWHGQDDPRSPVAKVSWQVRLRRTSGGWVVEGQQRLD